MNVSTKANNLLKILSPIFFRSNNVGGAPSINANTSSLIGSLSPKI